VEIRRLTAELAPIIDALRARDEAIARVLGEQRARLSALILQPGLFDRRYERAISAQQDLFQRAFEQFAARREVLEPLTSLHIGDVRHAFSLHAGQQ